MRTYTAVLASSVFITGGQKTTYYASATSSLDLMPSTALFQMKQIDFTSHFLVANNFSGPTPTGVVTLLMGATPELCNLAPAASAYVSTSGTSVFNVLSAGAEWMTVAFASSATGSSGFWTCVLQSKGY